MIKTHVIHVVMCQAIKKKKMTQWDPDSLFKKSAMILKFSIASHVYLVPPLLGYFVAGSDGWTQADMCIQVQLLPIWRGQQMIQILRATFPSPLQSLTLWLQQNMVGCRSLCEVYQELQPLLPTWCHHGPQYKHSDWCQYADATWWIFLLSGIFSNK